jgi:hypothetical protein
LVNIGADGLALLGLIGLVVRYNLLRVLKFLIFQLLGKG